MCLRRRTAFTLIELLVAIAIIGILSGLLLPAIQKVRAAASTTQCKANLGQIALAAANYETQNGVFPPGLNVSPNSSDPNPSYNYPAPWAGPYPGCLAYLLPYIDQGNVHEKLYSFDPGLFQLNSGSPAWAYGYGPFDFADPSIPPSLWNGTGKGYPKEAETPIKLYRCPADPGVHGGAVIDAMIVNVRPPLGWLVLLDWVYNIRGYGADLGRSNYLGVGGAFGLVQPGDANPAHAAWKPYTGIYYDNSETRAADITDGMSNTLAFGEYLGGFHKNGYREFELSWMGAGWNPTKWGLMPIYGPQNKDYYNAQFQSKHPGNVLNFALADGSVRGIKQEVDFTVFIRASGKADDMAVSGSDLD